MAKLVSEANQIKAVRILDEIEAQAEGPHLAIADGDWEFLRELVVTQVLRIYQIHAPVVMDEIDRRVNRGIVADASVVKEAEQVVKETKKGEKPADGTNTEE